jgi:hypothetical protein
VFEKKGETVNNVAKKQIFYRAKLSFWIAYQNDANDPVQCLVPKGTVWCVDEGETMDPAKWETLTVKA